jgi:hypothetical protein
MPVELLGEIAQHRTVVRIAALLQLAVFFDSTLEVFQPLVSLKNFTVPLKVTDSPVLLGRSLGGDNRNPARQRQWLTSLSPREIGVRDIPAADRATFAR